MYCHLRSELSRGCDQKGARDVAEGEKDVGGGGFTGTQTDRQQTGCPKLR